MPVLWTAQSLPKRVSIYAMFITRCMCFFTTSIFHGQPDLCLNSVTRKYDRYRPFVEVDGFDGYIDKLTSCLPRPYSRPSYLPNHHPKLLVPTSMHLTSPDFLLNSSVRNPLLIYIDRLGTFILVRV